MLCDRKSTFFVILCDCDFGPLRFRAVAVWLPASAVGIAVLSNLATVDPLARAYRIVDAMLFAGSEPGPEQIAPESMPTRQAGPTRKPTKRGARMA